MMNALTAVMVIMVLITASAARRWWLVVVGGGGKAAMCCTLHLAVGLQIILTVASHNILPIVTAVPSRNSTQQQHSVTLHTSGHTGHVTCDT